MSKKHLGVEFYRNFVGIEKPLKLEITAVSNHNWDDELRTCERIGKSCFLGLYSTSYEVNETKEHVKPYLRTIEDLSDEELIYIFTGQVIITHIGKYKYSIKRTETYIHLKRWEKDGRYGNSFHLIDMKFRECDEEILNRGYSLGWHPRAKEYIDNGLALRVEK